MIFIVTGAINCGKTSWIAADFNNYSNADGFACRKVFSSDSRHIGYDLERLGNRERCRFIRTPESLPPDWREVAVLAKRFSFCAEGFEFAMRIADSALANNCQRFYIDEIGPLELLGKGFFELFGRLLAVADMDLVVAIRSSLVDEVTRKFRLANIRLINIA
jgi:nucleoside-triphosphatase THEP1